MFQQTLDGSARGWFERLPYDSINEWVKLRDAFAARYSVRRACFKEPHKITKILSHPNWPSVFSDKVPTTVNEMMEKLDNFVRSEAAYASTKLPKGKTGETHRKASLPFNGRDVRPFRSTRPGESRRDDYRNSH
ncbi:hypothetical protein Tco_0333974, partial [Tanacetum coccineum]